MSLKNEYKDIISNSKLGVIAEAEAIAISGYNMLLLPKAGKVVKDYVEQVQ